MITRRSLLTGAVSTAAVLSMDRSVLSATSYPPEECWAPQVPEKPVKPEKAASMRRLLTDAMLGGEPQLGMTRIDGFVMDKGHVVIWGRKDPKREELKFDDLVVAIRSAKGKYGRGTPTISLDWSHGAFEKLKQAKGVVAKTEAEKAAKLNAVRAVCREVTGWTRIDYLPHDANIVLGLLKADHAMKEVSSGVQSIKTKTPFIGAHEILAREWQEKVKNMTIDEANKWVRSSLEEHRYSRFWFESGKISYILDGSTAFLDVVQVVLRDVPEAMIEKDGVQSTRDGPELAGVTLLSRAQHAYTCSFTNRMEEIVRTGQPWQGLNDGFRHFAFARSLVSAQALNDIDQDLLLKTYSPKKVTIASQFPHMGYRRTRKFKFRDMLGVQDGIICGGVVLNGIPVRSASTDLIKSDMQLAGRMALDSMRSCSTSCWDVT